jgi:hypothetical protein
LFKDYFDTSLRKVVPTSNTTALLKLKLKQTRDFMPQL